MTRRIIIAAFLIAFVPLLLFVAAVVYPYADNRFRAQPFQPDVWRREPAHDTRPWPTAKAFRSGDDEQALRSTLDYFVAPGALDAMPQEVLNVFRSNLREWEAITTSKDAFATPRRQDVAQLRVPVQMISGDRTLPMLGLTDAELERVLPAEARLIVKGASHDVCSEQAALCAEVIRKHVARN